ncbi:hypothetical protein [Campylobacter mucosalis]|uniref:hypothetical protein n=1 Tax=Campylobacter mucosalis TaxID=202 RepID=UPI001470541D|nr:hypothetical protein [Campylobacter mucosalis]
MDKVLESSFVSVVDDEIERIFLQINGDWFAVFIKDDSLNFCPSNDPITLDLELKRLPIITQFEGLVIDELNEIENIGFEINFADKSLVFKILSNSLKIGVTNYIYKI